MQGLTYAERAAVLDRCALGDEGASTVDARLVLEEALEAGGRDELLGLRMLFEWADRRRAATSGGGGGGGGSPPAETSVASIMPPLGGHVGRGKSKTKGGSKGVQITEPERADTGTGAAVDEISDVPAGENCGWIRDSVIEMLKGKAWLASQGK